MKRLNIYRAGRVNGVGPVLFMIRFLRADGSFGSCQCVEEGRLQSELIALARLGWEVRS